LDSIIQNEEIKSNYKILAEADLLVSSVSQVARKYNVFPNTIYRWRQKCKGFSSSEAKHLKVFEKENLKLKNLLAEKISNPNSRLLLLFFWLSQNYCHLKTNRLSCKP